MNLKRNSLSIAVRYGIVTGAVALLGLSVSSAFAQDAGTEKSSTELERIVVTGTRIRKVDLETYQPVLTISRQDIERQGFQSVADILQNISAAGVPPLSRAAPLSSGEAVGGQGIDLRNLGAQRTLILVNGKRLGVTTSGFQDITTIPSAIVERIEVLKDGASSIYGSDAIGGVINIITRSNYEGMQVNAYTGQYSQGDGDINKFDFVLGTHSDKGSLTMAFEHAREAGVAASDRDFSEFPQGALHPDRNWTTVGQYGGFVTSAARPVPGIAAGTRVILRPGGNPQNPADYVRQNTDTGGTAANPEGSTIDKSNTLEQTDLRTPLNRKAAYVTGTWNFTDKLRFNSDLAYTNRESSRTVAGYPFQAASFNTPMSAQSYFNPFGSFSGATTPSAIPNWWRRTWEQPRISDSDLDVLRYNLGLQGDTELFGRYLGWDVNYQYSQNKLTTATFGNLNLNAVRNAVGPSFLNAQGQVQCGTAAAPIPLGTTDGTCIPWNPFLAYGVTGQGALTGNTALQQYLFQEEHATGETSTKLFSANVNGELWELQGGQMGYALGAERREEKGEFVPDALAVTGGSTNLSARPTRGGYDVNEIYGELNLPLLKEVPFANRLNVDLASRHSDYSTFGSTTNSKLGVEWKPLEQLLIRGSWSEGFRAPTISNLYSGGSQTFSFYTDPCDPLYGAAASSAEVRTRCAAAISNYATFRQLGQGFLPAGGPNTQTPLAFFQGTGNTLLQPETSKSHTLGAVWSPQWVEGLNMSLDYWNIRIKETIVTDSATGILDDCYVQNIASRCSPALFTRDPVTGIVNNMNIGLRNAGYTHTDGFDFDLSYHLDTADWGNFNLNWQTTYVSHNTTKSTNDPNVLPTENNSFAASGGAAYRIRSNAQLNWTYGDFGVVWGARYFQGVKERCLNAGLFPDECNMPNYIARNPSQSGAYNRVGANTFHDVQVRWNAPWNATFAIGANNVFDHIGPQMYSQPNANVSYNGDLDIGRFIYAKYQQRF